jgi:type I restriction enzyme S subunit
VKSEKDGMSWEKVKLGDVLTISKGKKHTPIENGNNRYINIENLHNASNSLFTNELGVFVEVSDLIIAWDGANAGKVGVGFHGVIGSTLARLRIIADNIDPRFLFWYLESQGDVIKSQRTGATIPHINGGALKDLQIPLPPLAIQKRIAEILDAADALRRKDQELLKKYDELAQAIFIDMFGDPVKNEKGWEVKRLGDCLVNIQIGPFGTQLHESDYIKNGIPIINPMHIADLKIKPNYNYSISEKKYLELPQYHLKENDIILGRRGEMGRCAIVTKELGKCLCGTGSLYLTVNIELLDPLFLVYILSRKSTKIALENVSAGTTMANLNKNIIGDFRIILPDIKKQRDFVRAVKLSEDSIEFTNQQNEKSNYLFQTLIQKAFKGELVN